MFSKVGVSERAPPLDVFDRCYVGPEFPVNSLILGIGIVPSPESRTGRLYETRDCKILGRNQPKGK